MSKRLRPEQYHGRFEDLRRDVEDVGARGFWEEQGIHKIYFADDGAVVGWWSTTGTIVFQGDPFASRRLREDLMKQAGRRWHLRQEPPKPYGFFLKTARQAPSPK